MSRPIVGVTANLCPVDKEGKNIHSSVSSKFAESIRIAGFTDGRYQFANELSDLSGAKQRKGNPVWKRSRRGIKDLSGEDQRKVYP